jgi:hypothetical protein
MPEIGDVINLLSDNPTVVNDPELLKLATAAAKAADESREASAKARALKADLEDALNEKQLPGVTLPDRVISFKTTNSKQKTMKAMKQVLGDAAGKKLWDALPTVPSTKLDIPAPKVDEPGE